MIKHLTAYLIALFGAGVIADLYTPRGFTAIIVIGAAILVLWFAVGESRLRASNREEA